MANTGKDKKLATFNIDGDVWQAFQAKARENGSSASGLLKQWIDTYLGSSGEVPIKSETATYNSKTVESKELAELEERLTYKTKEMIEASYAAVMGQLNGMTELLREEIAGELSA